MALLTPCYLLTALLLIVNGKSILDVRNVDTESSNTVEDLLERLGIYEKRLEVLENERVKRGTNNLQEQGDDLSRIIAFTASVNHERLSHLDRGQTLVYEYTLTNEGGAYNNHTGIFTCPISGVYVFHITTMVEPNTVETVELVRDGHNLVSSYMSAIRDMHSPSTSALVTTEVLKGEQVWVRTFKASNSGTGVLHGNGYTTFSGWIIAYI